MTKEQILKALIALRHKNGRPPTDMEIAKMVAGKMMPRQPTAPMLLAALSELSDCTVQEPKAAAWDASRAYVAMHDAHREQVEIKRLTDLMDRASELGDSVAVFNYQSKIDQLSGDVE